MTDDGVIDNKGKLSDEQIKNWRRVLCMMIGPYALIMSDEDVRKFHKRAQTIIENEHENEQETKA